MSDGAYGLLAWSLNCNTSPLFKPSAIPSPWMILRRIVLRSRQHLCLLLGHYIAKTHEHDTHYLRILVAKLRQKLGDDAAAPRWIVTEPGVGLRLRDGRA